MKYQIRQKVFSFRDQFAIKDDNDIEHFYVEGEFFSFGKKLRIYGLNNEELIYIEQKLFRYLPEYNIYASGEHLATVTKKFTFFKPKFSIESTTGDYQMEGDFFNHDFDITKDGRVVATVSKKFFSFPDTYLAEVADEEDQAFMVALVIVIDQVLHDNKG